MARVALDDVVSSDHTVEPTCEVHKVSFVQFDHVEAEGLWSVVELMVGDGWFHDEKVVKSTKTRAELI